MPRGPLAGAGPAHRVVLAAAALTLLASLTMLLPSYGHGDVDEEFIGPFATEPAFTSLLAQSYTPTHEVLTGVDLFVTTAGSTVATERTLTLHVREYAADGLSGLVLATGYAVIPSGQSTSTVSDAFVAHVDMETQALLALDGRRYVIQVDSDDAYHWAANTGISATYTGGTAFLGGQLYDVVDFGFRTYYGAAEPTPTATPTAPPAASDTTAPVITSQLTPLSPDGSNGWYRSDVTLAWDVADASHGRVRTVF